MVQENYNGFSITCTGGILHEIYRYGKKVFTANHLQCFSMEQAKILIDASNKQKELQERQSIAARKLFVISGESCELENGSESCIEAASWLGRNEQFYLYSLEIIKKR